MFHLGVVVESLIPEGILTRPNYFFSKSITQQLEKRFGYILCTEKSGTFLKNIPTHMSENIRH